ncbi:MAG: class I SAM-dependent methyltransferase [Verrucomicrobiota bacterium]
MKRSFDSIAHSYATLERLTFGGKLQSARTFGLSRIDRPIERALLIGDGNGSFAIELLRRQPSCRIDSLDISPKMHKVSRQRIDEAIGASGYALKAISADARNHAFDKNYYDFVGLHFILDCLSDEDCMNLVRDSANALNKGGYLSFADFNIPSRQPSKFISVYLIRCLYFGFNLATGLKTNRLPKFDWPVELSKIGEHQQLGGILKSLLMLKSQ